MNKPNSQHLVGQAADPTPHTGLNGKATPFTKFERIQDPRETAQERFHQVTARATILDFATGAPVKHTVDVPVLVAARGDDDLMSKPGELS